MTLKPVLTPLIDRFVINLFVASVLLDVVENSVDHVDHRLRATIAGRSLCRFLKIGKLVIDQVKNLSHAATPAKDRLLHIANAEEGTKQFRIGGYGLSERANDLPLGQRSILKLIEQQVLDLMVKPKRKPLGVPH